VQALQRLTSFWASGNGITSEALLPLSCLPSSVRMLDLSHNAVTTPKELQFVLQRGACDCVESLDLRGNACVRARKYRQAVVRVAPRLCELDGRNVSPNERHFLLSLASEKRQRSDNKTAARGGGARGAAAGANPFAAAAATEGKDPFAAAAAADHDLVAQRALQPLGAHSLMPGAHASLRTGFQNRTLLQARTFVGGQPVERNRNDMPSLQPSFAAKHGNNVAHNGGGGGGGGCGGGSGGGGGATQYGAGAHAYGGSGVGSGGGGERRFYDDSEPQFASAGPGGQN
jgi:hypothetical protein